MSKVGKQIPVLTPAYGRRYKSKEECLEDYLAGKEFVFNMANHQADGHIVTVANTYYNVVQLRFGNKTYLYEGN